METVMLRLVAVVMFGLILCVPAEAASFDCGQARTPFANAVCGNPDLSKADETVAKALQTAIGGLSAPAKAEVSSAHDAWVKYANVACTDDARPAKKPYNADAVSCLQNIFTDRIEQLQNSKMIGGLRIYYVDRYAALRDPDPAHDNANVATKSVSTPRIDGTDAEAVAFNHFIETGTKAEIDPAIATDPKPDDGAEDDADSLIVTAVNPFRITMTANSYMFGHGAAHGNYGITYLHYLRGKGRPLVPGDVFAAKGWQQKLQALALAAVKRTEGEDLLLDDPTTINDLVIDPARWDFSSAGLVLQLEPYEVAPYAAGAPTVTIPWSELGPLLAPGAADFQQ